MYRAAAGWEPAAEDPLVCFPEFPIRSFVSRYGVSAPGAASLDASCDICFHEEPLPERGEAGGIT
jgi:hypothetical protein